MNDAMIKKYGTYVKTEGRESICKVVCQGCGKEILSNSGVEIGYSISKRGSANFWHKACEKNVWSSKVRWTK